MKILVIMHINVSEIDVSIFSVRKKKNLLKESKVWILIPEQLLQPTFRRYFGGVSAFNFGVFWGGMLHCRKGTCTCSMASKSQMWFAYWVVVVSQKRLYFFTWFTKRFHDGAFLGYIFRSVPESKFVASRIDCLDTYSEFSLVKSLYANFFIK